MRVLPLGLPDLPFHVRLDALSAFFLLILGAAGLGDLAVLGGLLPLQRGHRAGTDLLPLPRLPRVDGARADRRRRLLLHGRVGVDGAVVVLPRHHRAPDPRDPPRRVPLPPDRARRGHRDPALLRRAAGRQRRLHVRRHALGEPRRPVAVRRLLPRAVRLRRQGRPASPARLAARGASGRAVPGVGADERRHAQDGDLRTAARVLRPPARPRVVVGRDRAGAGPADRALRRRVRRRAERHEAAARLFVDREHRRARRRAGPRHPLRRVRDAGARRDRDHRGLLPRAQPRILQEPAVPRHRLGAARHPRAQPRQAGRADPPHAVGRRVRAGGHARHRRAAPAQRLRLGVAAAAGLPVHAEAPAIVREHAGAARGRRPGARGRAGRVRDGQVLRRDLPRPAARAEPRPRARRGAVRAVCAGRARARLRAARRVPGRR